VLLDMCRMNAGAALRPVAATLCRPKPQDSEVYQRFFGCAVRFRAEEDAFVVSAQDAERPLPSANRQLAAVFDTMLTEQLGRLDRSDVVSRCRAEVIQHLESGEVSAIVGDLYIGHYRMGRTTLRPRDDVLDGIVCARNDRFDAAVVPLPAAQPAPDRSRGDVRARRDQHAVPGQRRGFARICRRQLQSFAGVRCDQARLI